MLVKRARTCDGALADEAGVQPGGCDCAQQRFHRRCALHQHGLGAQVRGHCANACARRVNRTQGAAQLQEERTLHSL